MDKKNHWENIYSTKELKEVSWYQPKPETSLNLFQENHVALDAQIIDVGGGDSFLVDNLIELGYTNVTVLDISETAIERAKERLGLKADLVNWVVSDILNFQPNVEFDVWHDRAAFHFLTQNAEIEKYKAIASNAIRLNGLLFLGTFSENGPLKCSGIEIKQYSEQTMMQQFNDNFEKVKCFTIDHPTPFDTIQNFQFCTFRKL